MGYTFRLVAVSILAVLLATPASAAKLPIPVFWGTPEKIAKVADFPDTADYQAQDGSYVDAGVKYKTFEIFAVPLWDYDHTWAGYVGRDDTYMTISHDDLSQLAAKAGVTLPATPSAPFWDAWGGKLVAGGLILALLYFFFAGGGRGDEPEQS